MRKRILLIEDQAEIRKLIRMTLEFEYYEIHEAANATEALAAIERLRPELVLLDIMMPGGMNGLDLCRLIKSDPALQAIQVVMLSARGQSQDIEAGFKAGANAYLVNPFSARELIVSIDSMGAQCSEIAQPDGE